MSGDESEEESFHSADEGGEDEEPTLPLPKTRTRTVPPGRETSTKHIPVKKQLPENHTSTSEDTISFPPKKTISGSELDFTDMGQVKEEAEDTPTPTSGDKKAQNEPHKVASTPASNKVEDDIDKTSDVGKKGNQKEAGWGEDWDDWDVNEDELVTPDTGLPPTAFPTPLQTPYKLSEQSLSGVEEKESGSLWGGLNNFLTGGLSSLTEGLSTVMESVENSLGAMTPEELARLSVEERLKLREKADQVKESWPTEEKDDCDSAEELNSDGEGGSEVGGVASDEGSSGYQSDSRRGTMTEQGTSGGTGFGGLLSGVSSVFETTGKSLVTGSLDVLETLGKKTFNVLTETEEGSNRKRFILSEDKPNLSGVLRELKAKGEREAKEREEEEEVRKCNYAFLFEEYQGLISLEALEMLSNNCAEQVETQIKPTSTTRSVQDELDAIQQVFQETDDSTSLCEESDQDFAKLLREELGALNLPFGAEKLYEVQQRQRNWVDNCAKEQELSQNVDPNEVYRRSVECLAELTARSVETFLKLGQLLVVSSRLPDPKGFSRITKVLCDEVGILSAKYSSCLSKAGENSDNQDSVNALLTNLFLEAHNSSTYIKDAFQLLGPVNQITVLLHNTNTPNA